MNNTILPNTVLAKGLKRVLPAPIISPIIAPIIYILLLASLLFFMGCSTATVTDTGGGTGDDARTGGDGNVRFELINVTNVDDDDDTDYKLDGADAVTTAEVDGTTYLFVGGRNDNGVSVFSVANDGMLSNTVNISDNNTLNLSAPSSLLTTELGNNNYLFVSGQSDDEISAFSIGNGGTLNNTYNSSGNSLSRPSWLATAAVGTTNYLFITELENDAVSVFSIATNNISLTKTTTVSDADDTAYELDSPLSATTALVGNTNYLFVAGFADNGVSVFSIGNDGSLVNVANVDDDENDDYKLTGVQSVTTAEVAGITYLFTAAFTDNGVSVFRVANNGSLVNVANVDGFDGRDLNLNSASGVTTAEIDGTTYLFVTASDDDGVSVFSVGNDGSLVNVFNVDDDADLELDGATGVTTTEIDGTTYLFVTGRNDDGVSVFRVALSTQ